MVNENNTSISICILRLSSIGDVTHVIPIISTLQKKYKDPTITWVIGKVEYELVKNLSNINFVVIDKNDTINSIMKLRSYFKDQNFDVVFHMQKSLRSKLIANIIKGRVDVTFNEIETDANHVLDHFFKFLEKINITDKFLDWKIDELLSNEENNSINKILDESVPFISINPFTSIRNNNFREWDFDNFLTLSEYCKNEYSLNTVLLGKTSKEKSNEIESYLDNNQSIINLINRTSLLEMLSILNKSQFYIGPDSGTLHMARMLDLPVIGLYATSNPLRTGPYCKLEYTINKYPQALEAFLDKKTENVKWGERVRNREAMKLIKIDDVKVQIKRVMKDFL
tara:strand:- start:7964 stop:8983 length:1020 start_codon:yes stop_codon:yes gene_type:complete